MRVDFDFVVPSLRKGQITDSAICPVSRRSEAVPQSDRYCGLVVG